MSSTHAPSDDNALVTIENPSALAPSMLAAGPLTPIMDLATALERLKIFQAFVKEYLEEGEDYGRAFPEQQKPSLFKPGADKLCELYGLADDYEEIRTEIDWESGLFDYEIRCILTRDGRRVATGLGCCSTFESKYKYRDASRKCPNCGKATIIKDRYNDDGGWICWKKKGGCGAKFANDAPVIVTQVVGPRVDNPDIADQKNTVLKMAKKRAKIDATLSATRSSGIFTQDIEDEDAEPAPKKSAGKKSAPAATAPAPAAKDDPAPKSDDGYINNDGRRTIYAAAQRVGIVHEQLKDYLSKTHNVEIAKIPRTIADETIRWLAMLAHAQRMSISWADLNAYLRERYGENTTIFQIGRAAVDDLDAWLQFVEKDNIDVGGQS